MELSIYLNSEAPFCLYETYVKLCETLRDEDLG